MNITERARQYMEMYENTLRPTDVPETPEAAIELAGKFAVPDNTQFYRDRLEGLAAKRAEALKDNRWLALAQFGAGIADGRPNSLGTAAQSGLAALRSANMEDKAGEAAELESRLKLAGMDQARTAAQMGNAREMYTSGLAAKRAAKEKALGLSIDSAQSDRSNALGYAQLRENDPDARYAAAMRIPGVTEKDARAFAFGTKTGDRGQVWLSTAMNYLKNFDTNMQTGVRPSKDAQATADLLREKVNAFLTSGELPAEAMVDNEQASLPNVNSGVDLPMPSGAKPTAAVSPAAVAEQAAGMTSNVAEMANKGDILMNKAGSYDAAKAQIAGMKLPQRDKIELLTALEAAKNRRMAMAGARGQ